MRALALKRVSLVAISRSSFEFVLLTEMKGLVLDVKSRAPNNDMFNQYLHFSFA